MCSTRPETGTPDGFPASYPRILGIPSLYILCPGDSSIRQNGKYSLRSAAYRFSAKMQGQAGEDLKVKSATSILPEKICHNDVLCVTCGDLQTDI